MTRKRLGLVNAAQDRTAHLYRQVLPGLQRLPKRLPTPLLYDARGSHLFDAITRLPEYYLTRAEAAILQAKATEVAHYLGDIETVIELGSGSGAKTRRLLAMLPRVSQYVAVDISAAALDSALATLGALFPGCRLRGIAGDYLMPLSLPVLSPGFRPLVVFFGSTIGNLSPVQAQAFLQAWAERLGPGTRFLIGVDRKKDPRRLHLAYNDAQGITAAFNLNLLVRLNRELAATFDPSAFRHQARYNLAEGRIEMFLVSTGRQTVQIAGRPVRFEPGEAILTEYSYKYTVAEFLALAAAASLHPVAVWSDPEELFSLYLLHHAGADRLGGNHRASAVPTPPHG